MNEYRCRKEPSPTWLLLLSAGWFLAGADPAAWTGQPLPLLVSRTFGNIWRTGLKGVEGRLRLQVRYRLGLPVRAAHMVVFWKHTHTQKRNHIFHMGQSFVRTSDEIIKYFRHAIKSRQLSHHVLYFIYLLIMDTVPQQCLGESSKLFICWARPAASLCLTWCWTGQSLSQDPKGFEHFRPSHWIYAFIFIFETKGLSSQFPVKPVLPETTSIVRAKRISNRGYNQAWPWEKCSPHLNKQQVCQRERSLKKEHTVAQHPTAEPTSHSTVQRLAKNVLLRAC